MPSNKTVYEGYLGGVFEDMDIHETLEDAERGISTARETLLDVMHEHFDCKKVRITIEEIE